MVLHGGSRLADSITAMSVLVVEYVERRLGSKGPRIPESLSGKSTHAVFRPIYAPIAAIESQFLSEFRSTKVSMKRLRIVTCPDPRVVIRWTLVFGSCLAVLWTIRQTFPSIAFRLKKVRSFRRSRT